MAVPDGRRIAIPLDGARPDREAEVLAVPLTAQRVLEAPAVQRDVDHIPPEAGRRMREFFGLTDPDAVTAQVPAPAGRPRPPRPGRTRARAPEPEPDEAPTEVTLSREELVVDTRARAVERVRVRKVLVSEEVTVTVTLHHEELRIERETIDPEQLPAAGLDPPRGTGDAQLVDGSVDFVLMAEEPVIGKRVRPVERVRVHRDTVTQERVIDEQVRVEQVEVDQEAIHDDEVTRSA